MARILVVGIGYVGLTTAISFAKLGHDVLGYDFNGSRIEILKSGEVPFFEPGMREALKEASSSGRINFTSEVSSQFSNCEFAFLCVPTPQDQDGSADLSHILDATRLISPALKPGTVLVTKSTVPVGSAKRIKDECAFYDIHVASNPEFLREGSALYDFLNPDRIVVGADSDEIANRVSLLYEKLNATVLITNHNSAELIKYASNSFLAMRLSFVNELAGLCEKTASDSRDVLHGMGLDSRIGSNFNSPGPGWGGSCFPKDTKALQLVFENHGLSSPLIEATLESNERTKRRIVDTLSDLAGGSLEGKIIGALGLAFKSETDDTRESPAVAVITRLISRGAQVRAYDPVVRSLALEGLTIVSTPHEVAEKADVLVVLTEWKDFKSLSPEMFLKQMSSKKVLDARGVLEVNLWSDAGAELSRIGAKNA